MHPRENPGYACIVTRNMCKSIQHMHTAVRGLDMRIVLRSLRTFPDSASILILTLILDLHHRLSGINSVIYFASSIRSVFFTFTSLRSCQLTIFINTAAIIHHSITSPLRAKKIAHLFHNLCLLQTAYATHTHNDKSSTSRVTAKTQSNKLHLSLIHI